MYVIICAMLCSNSSHLLLDIQKAAQCHSSLASLGASFQPGQYHFDLKDMYTLDIIPYPHLEDFIRALQSSLASGKSVKLFLSTRGPSVSFWNPSFILASIPFLPRRASLRKCYHHNPRTASHLDSSSLRLPCRTTTPMQASLSQVIGILTSGRHPLVVESVQNVTEEYASALNKYVEELEDDTSKRNSFLEVYGIDGWHEERLLASWEAGLLGANLLQEWSIVARK